MLCRLVAHASSDSDSDNAHEASCATPTDTKPKHQQVCTYALFAIALSGKHVCQVMLHTEFGTCPCACTLIQESEMVITCRSSSVVALIHSCLSLSQSCSALLLLTQLPQWDWLHVRYVTCCILIICTILHQCCWALLFATSTRQLQAVNFVCSGLLPHVLSYVRLSTIRKDARRHSETMSLC